MIDPVVLLAFVPAALALNFTPGPDMMLCLAQGMRSGRASAWAASAGVSTGAFVHVTIAGLGLGAVVAAFPWAFTVIRWIGVGYLLYLAVQAFRSSRVKASAKGMSPMRAYRAGLFTNLQFQGDLVCSCIHSTVRCAGGRAGLCAVSGLWDNDRAGRVCGEWSGRRLCGHAGGQTGGIQQNVGLYYRQYLCRPRRAAGCDGVSYEPY